MTLISRVSIINTEIPGHLLSSKKGGFSSTFCIMVGTNGWCFMQKPHSRGGFLAINAANTDQIREPTIRMDNSYTSYHNMFKDNLNIDMIY